MYGALHCQAEYAQDIPVALRKAIKDSIDSDDALKTVESILFQAENNEISVFQSFIGTTQAIDLIGGGVKSNALPEQAWAVVNHRIAIERSVSMLQLRWFHSLRFRQLSRRSEGP
jgi:Gly-Xaa carboxypeptidase